MKKERRSPQQMIDETRKQRDQAAEMRDMASKMCKKEPAQNAGRKEE
jgi:hypothetical protein